MSRKPTAFLPTDAIRSTVATLMFGILLGSASCVTVNVNFPEGAVQKATDDYVRELYRTKEKGRSGSSTDSTPSPSTPSSKPPTSSLDFGNWDFWNGMIPSAMAADLSFRLDSDKALKIRESLSGRLDQVLKLKRDGVLGESNDGYLIVKNPAPLKKAKMLQAAKGAKSGDPLKDAEDLVKSENRDREALYAEVLEANNLNKARLKDLQRSFARSFQAESPSGTHVQDVEGTWSQKP